MQDFFAEKWRIFMGTDFLTERIISMLDQATEQELAIIYQYIRTLLFG